MNCMFKEIHHQLDALARDECYRVDSVLKEGEHERTERVFFMGSNGAENGPYIRKYFDADSGIGSAYVRLWEAQRAGARFVHLPRINDCYEVGEFRVVVMEFVAGETLSDAMSHLSPSPTLAADLFPRICAAVREIHEAFTPPLIHRDLKPSNVMLSQENVTIIDFGIARSYCEGAQSDTRHFGTPVYAPPEQYGFGQTDVRSDVYALGVLLFFLLTGKTPSSLELQTGLKEEKLPAAFCEVILKATAFDPDRRYANVHDLECGFMQACAKDHKEFHAGDNLKTSQTAGKENLRERVQYLCARIPVGLGIAWDILLAAIFLLLFVAVVAIVIYPKPESSAATMSLGLRALQYFALVLLIVGPLLYVISDRRPLHRLAPRVFRLSLLAECSIVMALILLGFMLIGLSSAFAA